MSMAKYERYDTAKAITVSQSVTDIVTGSGFGTVTWGEWCRREMKRMNAVWGGAKVRIARDGGERWLTR
jgi:hypothetical protein